MLGFLALKSPFLKDLSPQLGAENTVKQRFYLPKAGDEIHLSPIKGESGNQNGLYIISIWSNGIEKLVYDTTDEPYCQFLYKLNHFYL